MKYIKRKDVCQPNDRLNQILDKINDSGEKSLTRLELDFLNSFSEGKEREMNDILLDKEMAEFFISDDGLFSFKLENTEVVDGVYYYKGTLTTPDKKRGKKTISGVFNGSIIVYPDKAVAIDFYNEKYDVFDMNAGQEYELDCFIDDIIYKIHDIR